MVVGPAAKMAPFRFPWNALRSTVSSPPPSFVMAAPAADASLSANVESATVTVPPAL
jgi:hypothetical protein